MSGLISRLFRWCYGCNDNREHTRTGESSWRCTICGRHDQETQPKQSDELQEAT